VRDISGYTHDGQVLEWSGLLDVLQCLLQVLELTVDLNLGLLGSLDGLGLESLNGLDLARDVVLLGLESRELLLDVVDDGGVLQETTVVGEVDSLLLALELGELAAGVIVALLEGDKGVGSCALERELLGELGPVELGGCVALKKAVSLCWRQGEHRMGRRGRKATGGWIEGDVTHSDGHCEDGLD